MDIGWPGNISLSRVVLNPGNANPITKWCWGWWSNLVPTGTFRCLIEKDKIAWKEENFPLIGKDEIFADDKIPTTVIKLPPVNIK